MNYSCELLIVNGINTSKGGSGSHLLNTWIRSLEKHEKSFYVFNTVPRLTGIVSDQLKAILLAIYFLPGTLLRVFRLPILELGYKISPMLIWNLIGIVRKQKPETLVFSHHSIFYLAYFFKRSKTHYIIHDLLYRRARSLGFNRKISRLVFWLECRVYLRAASLLCLSFQEVRILRRFGFKRISLLSSYAIDGEVHLPESYDAHCIALVSDWRRDENIHGATTYFGRSMPKTLTVNTLTPMYKIYGFGSSVVCNALNSLFGDKQTIVLEDKGFYLNYSGIPEGVFLVPIYQGAGIKIKVLDAFRHRRYVLGTSGAFAGMPRRWLGDISRVVRSMQDFDDVAIKVRPEAFAEFEAQYKRHFQELGSINFSLGE